jgi:hypothetical protein
MTPQAHHGGADTGFGGRDVHGAAVIELAIQPGVAAETGPSAG